MHVRAAVVIVGVVLGITSGAHAAEPARSIGLLVLAPPELAERARSVQDTLRAILEAETTLELAVLDAFSEPDRRETLKRCAGSARCFLDTFTAGGTSIDLLLTTALADLDAQPLVAVRLIDAEGNELASRSRELPRDGDVGGALEQLVRSVLPPDVLGRIAALEVRTEPAGAEVRVGAELCVAPCRFGRLAPGTYDVVVSKAGFATWTGAARLVPRETALVVATLEPQPAEGALVESPWFWGVVAVSVAALAAGTWIALRPAGDEVELVCLGSDVDRCP
ncbi:PEGA domain-containing protein [Myxococcota bacterium]|nr:PEGA domain-containing protein [Myxococcota bacterium]